MAVSGDEGLEQLAPLADHLIAVQPDKELVDGWNAVSDTRDRVGRTWRRADPDLLGPIRGGGRQRAHEQFRWFAGGWKVNADLPTPMGFSGASQFVRPEDVAESIPCGPDLDAVVEAVRPWWEAGFTDVALVQVGGEHQQAFLEQAAGPLLEKLRKASAA